MVQVYFLHMLNNKWQRKEREQRHKERSYLSVVDALKMASTGRPRLTVVDCVGGQEAHATTPIPHKPGWATTTNCHRFRTLKSSISRIIRRRQIACSTWKARKEEEERIRRVKSHYVINSDRGILSFFAVNHDSDDGRQARIANRERSSPKRIRGRKRCTIV